MDTVNYSTEQQLALGRRDIDYKKFLEIDYTDTETYYFWRGSLNYTYKGNTYIGLPSMVIDTPDETGRMQIDQITISLPRIRPMIRELNNLELIGKEIRIYYGILEKDDIGERLSWRFNSKDLRYY